MIKGVCTIFLIVITFSSISFADDIDQSTPLKTFEVFYEAVKNNDHVLIKKCWTKKDLKGLKKIADKNKRSITDIYLLLGASFKDLEDIRIVETKEFYSSGYVILTGIYRAPAQYNKEKELIPARTYKRKGTMEFVKEKNKWKIKTYKMTW